jgi:hypothetical protein
MRGYCGNKRPQVLWRRQRDRGVQPYMRARLYNRQPVAIWPINSPRNRERGPMGKGQRGALGHMLFNMTRSARNDRGWRPITLLKWVFKQELGFFNLLCLFLTDLLHFWGILGIFGGQILGGSWGCGTNSLAI